MNVAKLADRVIEVLDGKLLENNDDSLMDNEIKV